MEELETNTDTNRKLASIQIVDHIDVHDNATSLELATVLGWQVVTRIGETQPNQLVVYCEIDSVLPNAEWLPEAVKLKIAESSRDTFRLKTAKLRGEYSQGLIIPLVASMPFDVSTLTVDNIGDDVTEILGITKYEPSAFSGIYAQNAPRRKTFPSHIISKTEETRIQSQPKVLKLMAGRPYYATVKCDGTSGTFFIGPAHLRGDLSDTPNGRITSISPSTPKLETKVEHKDESQQDNVPNVLDTTPAFIVCSRNQVIPCPDTVEAIEKSPYWKVAKKYNLEEKLATVPHIAIQGEVCGPNVQSNMLGLKELELFVFNVVDLREEGGGRKLPFDEMMAMCKQLGLQTVPVEESNDEFKYSDVKALLLKSEGKYPRSKRQREGLVFRTKDQQFSFKVISNKYLLKTGQ